jgi:VCBS repeat-containing protein
MYTTIVEDAIAFINLRASDVDGDSLIYTVVSGPTHGTLSGSGASRTYTPFANYNGTDSFTFQANDGSLDSNIATFSITVAPENDLPVAASDNYSVGPGGTLTVPVPGVLANDTDPDSPTMSPLLASGPSHGTLTLNGNGSFTYIHDGSETTSDSFTYFASDGTLNSNIATVSITVTPGPVNHPPVAQAQLVTAAEDTARAITLIASDVDGDSLTYAVVSGPAHGTLSGSGASLTYTPSPNYNGPDSFTFKAHDGQADSNSASVTINVEAVNDPPSFTRGTEQNVTDESGPQLVTAWATAMSAGPPDEASQSLTFQVTSDNGGLFDIQPAVTAAGTLSYAPRPNVSGTATVTVRLIDSGGTAGDGSDTSLPQSFTISVAKPRKWHNTNRPLDVNDDGSISPLDALIIFNRLNSVGPGQVPADAPLGPPFLDTTGDNAVSPLDALLIFNVLNNPEGAGEGGAVVRLGAAAAQASLEELITLLAEEQASQLPRRRAR